MLIFNILLSICLASFGGVIALRLPANESFVKGRSHCDYCYHQLTWYQIIPIISYLYLQGKCAYCQHRIQPTIFIIEIIGLIAGLEASFQHFYNPYILISLIITVAVAAMTDVLFLHIWPIILLPTIISTVIWQPLTLIAWKYWLVWAIILILLFTALHGKIGFGDIEVMLLLALVLGINSTLEIVLLATIFIMIYYAIYQFNNHKLTAVAFVPFLLLALLIRLGAYCLGFCQ